MCYEFMTCWTNPFTMVLMKSLSREISISIFTFLVNIYFSIFLTSSCTWKTERKLYWLTLTKVIIHMLICSVIKSVMLSKSYTIASFFQSNSTFNVSLEINLELCRMHKSSKCCIIFVPLSVLGNFLECFQTKIPIIHDLLLTPTFNCEIMSNTYSTQLQQIIHMKQEAIIMKNHKHMIW